MERRRTHVLRIKEGSRNGVGGFFEAILAMMVVTVGVLLLTSSIALSSREIGDVDHLATLQEKCLNLRDRLLLNSSIMRGDWLSSQALLHLQISDLEPPDGFGELLSVTEWNGSSSSVICSLKTSNLTGGEQATLITPVGVQHAGNEIRAGLLMVCVWKE